MEKSHQRLLCEWAHGMMGRGRVTGVAPAQRHSLLKVRRDKNRGRCRWQREKRNATKFLKKAYHSTTSNMRAHGDNVTPNEHAMMPGTPTKQPRLHSVSPPATSSLSAAQQEAARRNLLHSYVRTRGWSVSLMASESFVKNWNWGIVSQKHLYKQLCVIVLVCPPVIDIMHK